MTHYLIGRDNFLRRLLRPLLLIIFYFALACLLTWPLIQQISTHLPAGTDTLLHYWNGWWMWQALAAGESPYFTPYLFHPNGLSMVYNNFALLHILGFGLLRPLLSAVAAYNLVYLFNLALCGLSAFWLAKTLTGDNSAALIAGVIYQAWPHRLTQPDHPNLMSTWPIPLFLLFLYRTTQTKRWRDAILTGLLFALVGYMRWQLLIPAVLMGGIFLLFLLWGKLDKQVLVRLLAAGLIGIIFLLPPILLFIQTWQAAPTEFILEGEELRMQTDLAAYLTPPADHSFFSRITEPLYARYYPDRGSRSGFSPYLGVIALGLALIGIFKSPRRQMLPWLVMAIVLLLLALGPTLRVMGVQVTAVPMLYSLAGEFFIVRLLREPDRFNMFLALPMALLAAYGLLALRQFAWWQRCRKPLAAGLAVLVVLDYLVIPFPLQAAAVSSIFNDLAQESDQLALLNIPVDPYKSKPYMFAQVTHQHPILQGHSSRYPQGAFAYLESQPWLFAMLQFDQIPPKFPDVSRQLADLAAEDIGYLVVNKMLIEPDYWADWRDYLIINPLYADETVDVYTTMPQAGVDFDFEVEMLPGMGIVKLLPATTCVNPGAVWAVDVAWGTAVPLTQDLAVKLELVNETGTVYRTENFPVSAWPASEWPQNGLTWGYYALTVPADVVPGVYQVELSLHSIDGTIDTKERIEIPITISAEICENGMLPGTADPVNLSFGDEIKLLGFATRQTDDALELTLYWQGAQHMAADYKLFVHLFDATTGVMAAQYDAMPREWSYPTSYWPPGKLIDDKVLVSLDGIGNGRYYLAVGLYNPLSGERLPVIDAAGQPIPDNRPILRTIELDR